MAPRCSAAGGCLLGFLDRPRLDRAEVILPPDLLDGIERQVLGIARYAASLLASGQHLKRGVLLHGPPGTGKTHTVRYLLGRMPGVTAIVISGAALRRISEACSIARALQPSAVVLEDVDLIAEPRCPTPPAAGCSASTRATCASAGPPPPRWWTAPTG